MDVNPLSFRGVTKLLNLDQVNPEVDLASRETAVLGVGEKKMQQESTVDHAKRFEDTISKLTSELKIRPNSHRRSPSVSSKSTRSVQSRSDSDSYSDSESSATSKVSEASRASRASRVSKESRASRTSRASRVSKESRASRTSGKNKHSMLDNLNMFDDRTTRDEIVKMKRSTRDDRSVSSRGSHDSYSRNRDRERDRTRDRGHSGGDVKNLLGGRNRADMTYEEIETHKIKSIDEIDNYCRYLTSENVNFSHIDTVTRHNTVDEIETTRLRLKLLTDRTYYSSSAEEMVMMLGKTVEHVFDGKTQIPILGWKPNYTGYSRTLQVKIPSVRPELAEVMSNIVDDKGLGNVGKIAMKLLPSFLMYPSVHQKVSNSIANDPRVGSGGNIGESLTSIRQESQAKFFQDLDDI